MYYNKIEWMMGMSFLKKVKTKIRNNIPAGRRYIDKKIQVYNQRFIELQNNVNDNKNKISELNKKIDSLESKIELQNKIINDYIKENKANDERQKELANLEWQAKGKSTWVIKTPIPNNEYKQFWGEYHYASSLKKYLERLGIYVLIDNRENIYDGINADVVLVLRGKRYYTPDRRNKKCKYIMWNICHPSEIEDEEYELYDAVCVASYNYSKVLKNKISVPIFPLLQCTDTELFYLVENNKRKKYGYIFVGNTRNAKRDCVNWAIENKVNLKVWGREWEKQFQNYKDFVVDEAVPNDKLPYLYRDSKVTFNDHWEDMKEHSFINNRTFDALACGLPIISDYVLELEELFGDVVLCYKNKEEFLECIEKVNKNYKNIKRKVDEVWPLIKEKYSFKARAKELIEIVDKIK